MFQTVGEDGTFEETEVFVDSKDLQDIQNVIDQYPQSSEQETAATSIKIEQTAVAGMFNLLMHK